jgi:hypothetical protein
MAPAIASISTLVLATISTGEEAVLAAKRLQLDTFNFRRVKNLH